MRWKHVSYVYETRVWSSCPVRRRKVVVAPRVKADNAAPSPPQVLEGGSY